MLLYENEKILCKVTAFTEYAEGQFDRINGILAALRRSSGVPDVMRIDSARLSTDSATNNTVTDRFRRQKTCSPLNQAKIRENDESSSLLQKSGSINPGRRKSLAQNNQTGGIGAASRLESALAVVTSCENNEIADYTVD